MAEWVIRCMAREGGSYNEVPVDVAGLLLQRYDPEYAGGYGAAWWTANVDAACTFAEPAEAWALWRHQSVAMPLRADGRPNRPLTTYTIEVLRKEDVT
jgi:hypothetical protein